MEFQQLVYVCDNCKKILVETREVGISGDVLIDMPDGWHHVKIDNDPIEDLALFCLDCSKTVDPKRFV